MVRMGESEVEAAAATDVHFTGDGVVDGGGMFAGANTACVAVRIAGGRFGGKMKCSCSSLQQYKISV